MGWAPLQPDDWHSLTLRRIFGFCQVLLTPFCAIHSSFDFSQHCRVGSCVHFTGLGSDQHDFLRFHNIGQSIKFGYRWGATFSQHCHRLLDFNQGWAPFCWLALYILTGTSTIQIFVTGVTSFDGLYNNRQQLFRIFGLGTHSACPWVSFDTDRGWAPRSLLALFTTVLVLNTALALSTHCRVGPWRFVAGLWKCIALVTPWTLTDIDHWWILDFWTVWLLGQLFAWKLLHRWTTLSGAIPTATVDCLHRWGLTALAYTVHCASAQVDWSTQFCNPPASLAAARKITIYSQPFLSWPVDNQLPAEPLTHNPSWPLFAHLIIFILIHKFLSLAQLIPISPVTLICKIIPCTANPVPSPGSLHKETLTGLQSAISDSCFLAPWCFSICRLGVRVAPVCHGPVLKLKMISLPGPTFFQQTAMTRHCEAATAIETVTCMPQLFPMYRKEASVGPFEELS